MVLMPMVIQIKKPRIRPDGRIPILNRGEISARIAATKKEPASIYKLSVDSSVPGGMAGAVIPESDAITPPSIMPIKKMKPEAIILITVRTAFRIANDSVFIPDLKKLKG